jgi:SSS family solute:Na+ symporter
MNLHWIDYAVMLIYVGFVVGIGFALSRYMRTGADFFLSGRSIPAWVCGLAFLSANLGALELVGMAASGAKYGIATCHFYWLGAIPAMIFLAVFMMPFYYGSKARSVPEYLKLRFDERTRAFNSCTFAVMTLFASGISIDLLAQLLQTLLGWNYYFSLILCSFVVLIYVLKGGLTSAMYTEVLQFFMIVLGFAPVVWLGLKDVGGWDALKDSLRGVAQNPAAVGVNTHPFAPDAWTSAWKPLIAGPTANPMGVDLFATVFGLGFVLSFGYWCTNFLVIQRAMAAKDMSSARRTPIIAALPKMLFPALVILPGMIAVGLAFTGKDGYKLPTTALDAGQVAQAYKDLTADTNADSGPSTGSLADALKKAQTAINAAPDRVAIVKRDVSAHLDEAKLETLVSNMLLKPISLQDFQAQLQGLATDINYNGIILSLLEKYCPPGLMGLALTALMASFMSGMAGNVTAFNTVWTYDLYQAYMRPNEPDAHYLRVGSVVTVVGVLLSMGCAFFAHQFSNAMDAVQLIFSFVNAPLFATFLLGMFWARTTSHGAFFGLLCGTATSALFHFCTIATGNEPGFIKGAAIANLCTFPSDMAKNFWMATVAFSSCFVLTIIISLATKRTKSDEELKGLVYSLTEKIREPNQAWYASPAFLGTVLLLFCLALNIYFW